MVGACREKQFRDRSSTGGVSMLSDREVPEPWGVVQHVDAFGVFRHWKRLWSIKMNVFPNTLNTQILRSDTRKVIS